MYVYNCVCVCCVVVVLVVVVVVVPKVVGWLEVWKLKHKNHFKTRKRQCYQVTDSPFTVHDYSA